MKNFINHSGGAIGSDSAWDEIGKEFGMVNNKHYYYGSKTPKGNYLLSKAEFEEGKEKVLLANKTLHRKPEAYMNLLARNWMQVKNSEAIFAIGSITKNIVDGGTGWAVQMAIDAGKPVFVFDQNLNKWFTWECNIFTSIDVPMLTHNFAGIGTREITNNGKDAIRDVYYKTKYGLTDQIKIKEAIQSHDLYIQSMKNKPTIRLKTFKENLGYEVIIAENGEYYIK